jgi:hypothetical protein
MSEFERSFRVDLLSNWDGNHQENAVRSLFERWALPGHAGKAGTLLRLAVRKGRVNFYVFGQSVAELSCGAAGPSINVHRAFVEGRVASGDAGDLPLGRNYVHYNAKALSSVSGAAIPSTNSLRVR